MGVAELEMVVFDIGGVSYGTEVSQILSVVRSHETRESQVSSLKSQVWSLKSGVSSLESQVSSLESISLVDLSMQLGMEGMETRGEEETRRQGDGARGRFALSQSASILLIDTTKGLMGVCVGSVRGVVRIPLERIEPLPYFLKSRIQIDCIWGIGKLEEELIILLDLDRYLDRGSQLPPPKGWSL